jgi:aryl-alcohol dehydrogenase-like predicted oxidoreductase
MSIVKDGVLLFDAVQATWNLLERSAAPALQDAHEVGMGVIIKEALANGRLTQRNTDSAFSVQRTLLHQEAKRLNTTLDALSLAAALAQPWADTVLSGAATVEHLRSNLNAFNVAWDDEAETQLAALAESPELYWGTRARLAWN